MAAKEFQQYPEDDAEHLFEAEETLSLSDLPLYSEEAANLDDFNSAEYRSSSSDDNDDDDDNNNDDGEEDLFEFTNQNVALPAQPAGNIIFCGKLISCEEPSPRVHEIPREGQASKHNKPNSPSSRSRTISEGLSGQQSTTHPVHFPSPQRARGSKVMPLEKYGYATRKISAGHRATVMAYPTPKSNSYLLMYGLSKFPTEMELRDTKKKRGTNPSRLHQPSDGNKDQKGLRGVMRAISCKSYHPNSMVKTSIVSPPRS